MYTLKHNNVTSYGPKTPAESIVTYNTCNAMTIMINNLCHDGPAASTGLDLSLITQIFLVNDQESSKEITFLVSLSLLIL